MRDRPLTPAERKKLAAHVRRFALSERSETYAFRVAPAKAPGGVIAEALGKWGTDPDPEEDADTARMYAALTELRTLFAGAKLEVADDLELVGWDGERYDVVEDPDQEMTRPPRDRAAWTEIAPPVPRAPRRKQLRLEPALVAAIAAVDAGQPIAEVAVAGRIVELVQLAFAALERAEKAQDHDRRTQLQAVVAACPARTVVDMGLHARWFPGAAASSIGAAVARLDSLDEVRERVLALWFAEDRGEDAVQRRRAVQAWVMEPAMRDPQIATALGEALLRADLDSRRAAELHRGTMDLLIKSTGLPYAIRRRRADRDAARPPAQAEHLLHDLVTAHRREILPTLVLELARPGAVRDDILLAIGHVDDVRAIPVLERALATDQYTRAVTKALLLRREPRACELLVSLTSHVDPLVRIVAAQGLVARRGDAAVPALLAAIAHAQAAGIWGDHPPGAWASTFRTVDDMRERVFQLWSVPWPVTLKTAALPRLTCAADEVASAPVRMLSTNPDVRRDAIELTHRTALEARDRSRMLALAAAERWHAELCKHADLSVLTWFSTCSRVDLTSYWPRWRKLAGFASDPRYDFDDETWGRLEAQARAAAPQAVPDELTPIIGKVPRPDAALRLSFTPDELAAWADEERA